MQSTLLPGAELGHSVWASVYEDTPKTCTPARYRL